MMLGVDDVVMSSDCSSGGGCQSGWTMYLDQSSYSNHIHATMHNEDEEDLDLSMLSDASSGPSPLFHEDLDDDFLANNDCSKKIMTRAQTDKHRIIKSSNNPNNSYLDDTASSTLYEHAFSNVGVVNPALHHHSAVVDFSSSSSTTQFKDKSVFDSRLSYFQSPPVAKPMPQSQRPHVRKESGKKKMR